VKRILRSMIGKTALIICLAFVLTACSSAPSGGGSPSTEPSKPAEIKPTDAETGRSIFYKIYTMSRGWAPDTEPISIQSQNYTHAGGNPDAPLGHDGKSAIWRAIFASPSRRTMKTYMWSGLTGPDAPSPGITPSSEDAWSASNSSTQPFQLAYLKSDSDKALETAQKHGGAALLKKTPELPVNYSLNWEPRRSMLVWHVIYGKSTNEPDLDVVVNASSAEFIRVEK
jgi:hypothetical protein